MELALHQCRQHSISYYHKRFALRFILNILVVIEISDKNIFIISVCAVSNYDLD